MIAEIAGGEERHLQPTSYVTNVAVQEGLKFDYPKQAGSPYTPPNPRRLIWVVKKFLKQIDLSCFISIHPVYASNEHY